MSYQQKTRESVMFRIVYYVAPVRPLYRISHFNNNTSVIFNINGGVIKWVAIDNHVAISTCVC